METVDQKLDRILSEITSMKSTEHAPRRIPFPEFCKQYGITRPTLYSWNDRGLVQIEKVGGRNYIKADSVSIIKKYQRKENA